VAKSPMFVDDFKDLVTSCISFYEKSKNMMSLERVCVKRAKLSGFAEAFHKDCGTLTASVQKRLEDLRNGKCLILMTAHQPNFFAYGGVLRKATLNFVLAKKLEEILKVPIVNFFGIADQDFTDDRWVRSCQLPAVQRSAGVLSINMKLPEKLMLNRVAKPSLDLLKRWKAEVDKWLADSVRSVNILYKKQGVELSSISVGPTLHKNLNSFWNIVKYCHERSDKYSDFNAFMMSKIINGVWGYDTVFSRFSECQQVFAEDFGFLLSHFNDYSRLLKEAKQMTCGKCIDGGISVQEPFLVPFWYHCDCGSKAKLFLKEENGLLFGKGNCVGCSEGYELEFGAKDEIDITDISSRISARAIPMSLVFFKGLMPSCYIGGIGGITYLMEAKHVAKELQIPFPCIAVWRPHDKYLGIEQIEALLQLKQICTDLDARDLSTSKNILESRISEIRDCLDKLEVAKKRIMDKLREHPNDENLKEEIKKISINQTKVIKSSNLSFFTHELKILKNISIVLELMPSIIDYAVNVGLNETSCQWMQHLSENGSLSSNVNMDSVLSRIMGSNLTMLIDSSSYRDKP
jgi:uncharacterized protein YllA (UPF0747 family)